MLFDLWQKLLNLCAIGDQIRQTMKVGTARFTIHQVSIDMLIKDTCD